MYCLYCGTCCRELNPFSNDEKETCKHLVEINGFYLCEVYDHKPDVCKKHDYPAHICPIGLQQLNLVGNLEKIRVRIDAGWELGLKLRINSGLTSKLEKARLQEVLRESERGY